MRKKLVDDTKLGIKKMLQGSGQIPDQESRTPMEDKEAIGYMDLEVSRDEEREVEDNDPEPEEGDTIRALEEGNVVGTLEERDVVEAPEEDRDQAA